MSWLRSLRGEHRAAGAGRRANADLAVYLVSVQPYLGQVERVLMEEWPDAFSSGTLDIVQQTVARTMPVLQRAGDHLAATPTPALFRRASDLMQAAIGGYVSAGERWLEGDIDGATAAMTSALDTWTRGNEELDDLKRRTMPPG
ncbi:MAG: hypothetical protein WCK58_13565 [Chloroflexota bacterium]